MFQVANKHDCKNGKETIKEHERSCLPTAVLKSHQQFVEFIFFVILSAKDCMQIVYCWIEWFDFM